MKIQSIIATIPTLRRILTVSALALATTASSMAELVLDTWDGGGSVSVRSAGNSPGALVNVTTTTTIGKIAVRADLSGAANVKFVVFEHPAETVVFVSAPKAFADGSMGWLESDPISVVLEAGKSYDIGAIADVGGIWQFDESNSTGIGMTSTSTNPNFTNFASPIIVGHAGADGAVQLFSERHSVLFTKGDAVPGVSGTTFTGFGVPTVNEVGDVAFLGKWSGGAGIFINGQLLLKVGDATSTGATIKALKDPVMNNFGGVNTTVVIPATLNTSSATDSAVLAQNLFNAVTLGNAPVVYQQEGTQVGGVPAGILWKSFSSVAITPNGTTLILGALLQGAGGITSSNDTVLYSQEGGAFLLQEGTTTVGAKTVRSFVVLKAVSGSPGQTRAFNGNDELVSNVTFTDGSQTVLRTNLP